MLTARRSLLLLVALFIMPFASLARAADTRPNILFAYADDWSYNQAGVYGDPAAQTPTFDKVARQGVLFTRAFVDVPSCTASRGTVLSGQHLYRLGPAANLWSTMPKDIPLYTDLLREAGYYVGHSLKGWGPGHLQPGGRTIPPAGKTYKDFKTFLDQRPDGKPFCFWFGSHQPHRAYHEGVGKKAGIDLSKIQVPACMPDVPAVRSDLADYYAEVEEFDTQVAGLLKLLDEHGMTDNTIVVISGDNGLPFPRCKANLYDTGTLEPLAVRWPGHIKPGRTVSDFVNLCDLAPTFLEAAGVKPPGVMTARSFMNVLLAPGNGQIDPTRDHVVVGRERHTQAQAAGDPGGYPSRALRTADYLYIRNFTPDRWPAGTPDYHHAFKPDAWLADCDNGPSKYYMWAHRDDPKVKILYDLSFAKRPAEELYDLKKDPNQFHNVADQPAYAAVKQKLATQLMTYLKDTHDPRVVGGGERFDQDPYYGGAPKYPGDAKIAEYK